MCVVVLIERVLVVSCVVLSVVVFFSKWFYRWVNHWTVILHTSAMLSVHHQVIQHEIECEYQEHSSDEYHYLNNKHTPMDKKSNGISVVSTMEGTKKASALHCLNPPPVLLLLFPVVSLMCSPSKLLFQYELPMKWALNCCSKPDWRTLTTQKKRRRSEKERSE